MFINDHGLSAIGTEELQYAMLSIITLLKKIGRSWKLSKLN